MSPSYVIAGVDLEENSVDGSDFVDEDGDDDDYDDLVSDFVAELEANKSQKQAHPANQVDEDVTFHFPLLMIRLNWSSDH